MPPAKSIALLLPIISIMAVACGSADDSSDAQSGDEALSVKELDHDFPLPSKTFPLKKTFTETLTRYGVTVVPTMTVAGTFGFSDADIHAQVAYVANPPRVDRIDISGRANWAASARVDLDVKAGANWKTTEDFRKSFTENTSLGGKAWEVFKQPLAIYPLPQAPNLQLELDLELAVACELDFDAELHAYAEIGIGGLASADVYYNRTGSPKIGFVANGGETSADQFHVTTPAHVAFKPGNLAQLHGRCSVQPSLNATVALSVDPTHPLADVGVKLIVEPYAQFDGSFRSVDDWSIDTQLGIQGNVTPFGDFFGRPWQQTDYIKLFDFNLSRGSSNPSTPVASNP